MHEGKLDRYPRILGLSKSIIFGLYLIGKAPPNAFGPTTTLNVVRFLKRYAEKYGLPQPAAPRARPETPPIYLPCGTTKTGLHKVYQDSAISDDVQFVRLTTFSNIWKDTCPDIRIMSRREDCCAKCEQMRDAVIKARSEEEKQVALSVFQEHMNKAYSSRDYYNSCIINAKQGKSKHLIFDFAEQLTIPSTTRQVGPMYFKVGRRIQLFGICDTSLPRQANYLFDEHQTIGPDGKKSHGPNCVISMLHHYLNSCQEDIPKLVLHADNCCAQNKNKSVVAYLSWRMIQGLHKELEYVFMEAGHTRSLVDGCFGLIKMKYRRQDNYNTDHLIQAVEKSAASTNVAVTYPAWQWYNWDVFLAKYYKPIPAITKVSSIKFFSDGKCRTDNGDTHDIMKSKPKGMPNRIEPAGLTQDRTNYLRDKVAPLMPPEYLASICSS